MPSEAQKRARDKWDRENTITIGCKLRKEDGGRFKAYAAEQGKTANTLLKEYVQSCINKDVTK